jgi:PAS domain S-box-containing protein
LLTGTNTDDDIDDLKDAEVRLRTSERSLRLIINGIPGLIYTMTARGEVELVNDPTLQYFGRSLDELKDWAMTDAVHPDDLPRVAAEWGRAVESGGDYEIEQRLRGANGVYRWFHGKSLAVRDAEGRVIGWYGLLTDIDDRKRAERRLRRAIKARYEAAITERTRIARDMHDGLLQDITGIALKVAGVLPHIRSSPDVAEKRMELLLDSIQKTNKAARQAVVGMRRDANSADLVSAVQGEAQRLTTQASLALSTRVSGSVRPVPAVVRDVAVALVREGVTNVVKHARASGVRISVAFSSDRLRLALRDDGVGLTLPADPNIEAGHFGMAGMCERVASIGAALVVSSVPGRGTTIRLEVHLSE